MVSFLVEISVVGSLYLAVSFGRNDGLATIFSDPVGQMIGIVSFVGDGCLGLDAVDELMSKSDVVALAGCSNEANGKAQRFRRSMDFSAQAAARPAQALGIRPPLTLRAPAACWCARTMVLSIISHSRSASRDRMASMSSSTPISIQR